MPAKRPAAGQPRAPARRPAKRARRQPAHSASLPADVLSLVVRGLQGPQNWSSASRVVSYAQTWFSASRGLLLFGMTCRAAREAVFGDKPMWSELFRAGQVAHFRYSLESTYGPAVVRGLPVSPYPNFKHIPDYRGDTCVPPFTWRVKRADWPHGTHVFRKGDPEFSPAEVGALAEHALRRARLTHAPGCGLCGSRRKHVPVWGLGMRVCASCLKVNLVSSTSLFHEYGLDYTKHLDKIVGKVYFFHNTSGHTFAGQYLSDNPLDFRGSGKWGALFFWLPHLRKAVDLEASWASHRSTARREAARRLTSAVRALGVRLALGHRGVNARGIGGHEFYLCAPAAPSKADPGHFTDFPLNGEEFARVCRDLDGAFCRKARMAVEERARRQLQRSFLGYRGALRLPRAKNPAAALCRIRTLEAAREGKLWSVEAPGYLSASNKLRAWQDLPVSAPY